MDVLRSGSWALLVILAYGKTQPFGLWYYIDLYGDSIFLPSALKLLRTPFVYPPTIHILDVPLSNWRKCKVIGYLHQLEVEFPDYLKNAGALIVPNASADYVVVPHCIGNKLEAALYRTGLNWTAARISLAPYLRAWGGQLRRAGPRALVIITLTSARVVFDVFKNIPYVVSPLGASSWLEVNQPVLYKEVPFQFTHRDAARCSTHRTQGASGYTPFYYPDTWPQDIVIQRPIAHLDVTKQWTGADGRDFLFSYIGSNTSCVRETLVETWGGNWSRSKETGIYVGAEPPPWQPSRSAYFDLMRRSQYCLVPDGHVPWTFRLLEAFTCGCVPVIISASFHPPFHRLLRWGHANFPAVFVHIGQIPDLRKLLMRLARRWPYMQSLTFPLASILHASYYAFNEAVLAELAILRHGPTISRAETQLK